MRRKPRSVKTLCSNDLSPRRSPADRPIASKRKRPLTRVSGLFFFGQKDTKSLRLSTEAFGCVLCVYF